MPSKPIHETTATRLGEYGIFSKATITQIATFSQAQSAYRTYQEFFKAVDMPEPRLYVNARGEGVPFVDIAAKGKEKGVIVIHLPMANPLDANQLYQVATVRATNLNYRIIAFGNPSGAPFYYKEQNLNFLKRVAIWMNRNRRPLVAAELDYLQSQKLTNIQHIGYSYGAHKALIESSHTKPGLIQSLILIDPVAHPRAMKQLIEDFQRTLKPMGAYVDRTNTQTYFDARTEAARTMHHKGALKRPINIAIGFMVARLDFIPLLKKVVAAQSKLNVTVAWGTKSELGNDAHIHTSLAKLSNENPKRIHSLRLEDDKHAFANDIYLYAAIIYEALHRS